MSEAAPVSICIPVYNGMPFIKEALASALAQDVDNLEVLVVDNRSTDGTTDWLKEQRDGRLRVVLNDRNLGAEANWNKCADLARGRYVKLLCADDVLYPGCVKRQVEALEGKGSECCVLATCARDIVDGKGRRLMRRRFPGPPGVHGGAEVMRRTIRKGTNIIGEPSAVLMRAEVLRRAGFFDGSIGYIIDLDMWLRMLRDGDLLVLDETLCAFRVSRASWSSELGASQARHFKAFIDVMRGRSWAGISAGDARLGKARAALNGVGRNLVYRFLSRS